MPAGVPSNDALTAKYRRCCTQGSLRCESLTHICRLAINKSIRIVAENEAEGVFPRTQLLLAAWYCSIRSLIIFWTARFHSRCTPASKCETDLPLYALHASNHVANRLTLARPQVERCIGALRFEVCYAATCARARSVT